jgi:hypothetical protein
MNSAELAKFTVRWSGDEAEVALGDACLDVADILGETAVAECDSSVLDAASLADFPKDLQIRMHSSDGFGTFLFYEMEIYKDDEGSLVSCYICHQPNKYWEGKWGLTTFLRAVAGQTKFSSNIRVQEMELEDDWKRLEIVVPLEGQAAAKSIQTNTETIKAIMRSAEVALGGLQWKEEYEKDERAFCQDVIGPLLRRMGFLGVRYTQGVREYGKDFTFSELTHFGHLRHYGLQAKAGNVSGEVNSAIDELVGQADDAFRMPYYDIASTEPRFISTLVVAISGRFTANAKDKIVNKIPRGLHGSLLFLDRESIMELVGRYWTAA